jgi:hypothetical protein
MPSLKEIALSTAGVLRATSSPDPLPVTLMGYSVEQAAFLVRAIIAECEDANISFARIEVPIGVSDQLDWEGNRPPKVDWNRVIQRELRIFRTGA